MSTEQATLIDPENKRRGRKGDLNQEGPSHLRLASRPARNRVQRLVELPANLLQEAEMQARDRVFAEQASKMRNLDFSGGIDFYDEVTQFETGLIKMALEQTGGNQARAAELLHIKPTTLNSNIKLYKIECRS